MLIISFLKIISFGEYMKFYRVLLFIFFIFSSQAYANLNLEILFKSVLTAVTAYCIVNSFTYDKEIYRQFPMACILFIRLMNKGAEAFEFVNL